jgi:SAM-dependent methyltransferase
MKLICPQCGAGSFDLEKIHEKGCPCSQCGFPLCKSEGIVRALKPDRRAAYEQFLRDYGTIRRAEGRGSTDREYYLALPYKDLSGKAADMWRIRARSYDYFESRLLAAADLDILDLGAGNGWMSYRLARRGRRPVAVDIFADALDGLAAAREYGLFPTVEAEFDRLPFADAQFDLAVFNSSFHYSTDYRVTLAEARRCLKPSGRIVILDTPLYRRREHGEMMRAERRRFFQSKYGFPSDSLPSLEFLHEAQLSELSRDLKLRWQIYQPWYGLAWHLRPWRARLKGSRPPSRFCILEASFRP